jgi:hypothetical protein
MRIAPEGKFLREFFLPAAVADAPVAARAVSQTVSLNRISMTNGTISIAHTDHCK